MVIVDRISTKYSVSLWGKLDGLSWRKLYSQILHLIELRPGGSSAESFRVGQIRFQRRSSYGRAATESR